MKKLKMGLMLSVGIAVYMILFSNIITVNASGLKKMSDTVKSEAGDAIPECKKNSKGLAARSNCTSKNDKAKNWYKVTADYDDVTKKLTMTAAKGSFDISIGSEYMSGTLAVTTYTLKAGTPLVIDLTTIGEAELKIVALLNVDSATLQDGKDYCRAGCFQSTFTIIVEGGSPIEIGTVPNNSLKEGKACYNFVNSSDYLNAGAEGQEFFKKNLEYCFSPNVVANFKESTINALITAVRTSWINKNTPILNENTDAAKKGEKIDAKSGRTRDVGTLQCDAFLTGNNVKQYYTEEKTVVNDICSVDCVEELTVTYGPPAAVKAGLCFEYTVTVRSKVSCKTTINPDKIPVKDTVCNPYPVCNTIANYTDQAGPSEQFDSCVNTCDGGKYTQNCINKCYKKAYGNANEKIMLSYSDAVAQKTADNEKLCTTENSTSNTARGNKDANYVDVYNDVNSASGGYYYFDTDGKIQWQRTSNCYWDSLGRYYFNNLDKAGRTVSNIQGKAWGIFKPHDYDIQNGFKQAKGCKQNCKWVAYKNDGSACTNDGHTSLDENKALEKYNIDLVNYNNKIAECTSYNACVDKVAKYTMSVNTSKSGKITFGPSTNQSKKNKTATTPDDKANIIQEQGGVCYGEKLTTGASNPDDYRTTINFPGSWINNKTGEVQYIKPPTTEEKYFHSKPHQFCVSLDEEDVNKEWWIWKQSKSTSSSSVNEKNIKQNIGATITDFGKYSWSINISCFYAVYNQSCKNGDIDPVLCEAPTCTGKGCSDCKDKDCDSSTSISNYTFRVVDLENLFPASNKTTSPGSAEAARTTGYNWSIDATNINNQDYKVSPTTLIASIQTVGNDIYNEANAGTYLDYEIYLDSATLKEIKSKYKNKAYSVYGYNVYSGYKDLVRPAKEANGVTSYQSGLLSKLYSKGKLTKRGEIGCNNQVSNGRCQ